MIPTRWSPPSILEEEKSGRDSSVDILAEERERRLRRRRGFRSLWLGNWLTGSTGVAVLCIFLVAGVGWLGFRAVRLGRFPRFWLFFLRPRLSGACSQSHCGRAFIRVALRRSPSHGAWGPCSGAGGVHRGRPVVDG